jgi:hypothetical protein
MHYALPQDGLRLPWPPGPIWCNPPYGKATREWLRRMGEHRNGMALVFARTDTEWYHETRQTADAILFLAGRVKFVDHTGAVPLVWSEREQRWKESMPGVGSMLVAWGLEAVEALYRCRDLGHLVDLRVERLLAA